MENSKSVIMSWLMIFTMLVSCTKEGSQGPKGESGNPEVLVKHITVSPSTNVNNGFAWNNTYSFYEHYENNITELTQSVIDSGAVMLYLKTSNGWQGLPWCQVINTNKACRSWSFAYTVNQLYIMVEQNDNNSQWTMGSNYLFKLVIIPNAALRANPGLKTYDTQTDQPIPRVTRAPILQ